METTFTSKCIELMGDGISVTYHQVLKPRIRPILADSFRDIDYNITSAQQNVDADAEDSVELVPERFKKAWSQLTRPLRRIMTPKAWDKLLSTSLPYLASALEKRLWALHGRLSELGTTSLERDISGIVHAACGDARYGVRDSFARCTQIVMVAGMEDDEWEEISDAQDEQDGGMLWVLDKAERLRARGLIANRT
jgi:hypothetical protein